LLASLATEFKFWFWFGTLSSIGVSKNILSKYLKSLGPLSLGLNGASICFLIRDSQLIPSKKGCFLISAVF
jgi:hypothetical protein